MNFGFETKNEILKTDKEKNISKKFYFQNLLLIII